MLQKTNTMFALIKFNKQSLDKIVEYISRYYQIKLDFSIIAMIKRPNDNVYAPFNIFIRKSDIPKQTTYSLLQQLFVKQEVVEVVDKGVVKKLTLFGGKILIDGVYEAHGSLFKIDTRNLQANSLEEDVDVKEMVLNEYITNLFKKTYQQPEYVPNKDLPILDVREPQLAIYERDQLIPQIDFKKNYIDDDDIIQYLKEKGDYKESDDEESGDYNQYYEDDLDYELKQLGRYRYRKAEDFNNFDDIIQNNTPYLPIDQSEYNFYSDDEFSNVENIKTNIFKNVFGKVNVFTDSTLQDDYVEQDYHDIQDNDNNDDDEDADLRGKFSDEDDDDDNKFI